MSNPSSSATAASSPTDPASLTHHPTSLFTSMKLHRALAILMLPLLVAMLAFKGNAQAAFVTAVLGSAALATPAKDWQFRFQLNTLTNLIPDAYAALDVVSRELVGAIPSVTRDPSADRCALNATLRSPITPISNAAGDIAPAMALPTAAFQTIGNAGFTIQKSRYVPFSWTGEEQRGVDGGPGYLSLRQQQIAQAIRTLTNEVEADICVAGALNASRAYGTAGTTPFATNLGDSAQTRKILDDNGAAFSARSLIIDTTSGAALRTLQNLTRVNEAGDNMTLRDGELLNVHGFSIKESAQISNGAAVGTGAAYQLNGAHAVGATTITVDTGTGTILAGDIVTIAGHKYVVATALAAGSFTIGAPGLRAALADNVPVAVNAASTRNLAFTQSAILLGTRLPAVPMEGDLAKDREIITDDRSGLVFEIAYYPGFRMGTYHISLAWGVKVLKPEHVALLLG
jgi:hypothetical protein